MSAPPEAARVAVVIVNYQSYGEVHQCLAALDLPSDRVEVVVVDHASNPSRAAAIRAAFPRVRLFAIDSNDGFAAGVNRGARETRAPYLLLLNPDCIVAPGTCTRLVNWLEAHVDVAVVGPRILDPDGSLQASARRFPDVTTFFAGRSSWLTRVLPGNPLSRRNLPWRDVADPSPVDVDWVSGACMLVRRSAFDQVRGMDEGFFLYWEDADLCRRLREAGWRTVYFRDAVVVHTGGSSSRHAADASLEAFHRSAFRIFWKHARRGRVLAPVVFTGLQLRLALMKRLVRRRRERASWSA